MTTRVEGNGGFDGEQNRERSRSPLRTASKQNQSSENQAK